MGPVLSQGGAAVSSAISEEVEQSFNQILNAFNQDFPLQTSSRRHHQITHADIVETEEPLKHIHQHHRSRSLDRYHPDESRNNRKVKLSVIKRQWQCQLCHTKNESDTQICSECGSNKINVYIPVMDRNSSKNKHQQNSSPIIE
jgi:hypothetical protein